MKQKLLLKSMLLLFALIAGSSSVWAEETITLTATNLELGTSYPDAEASKTLGGVTYKYHYLMKNSNNIQAKADNGYIYNSTAFSQNIKSVAITHSGTGRATTISGSADGTNWTQITSGNGSITGNFTSGSYKYFKITRGSNAAYWTQIVITLGTADASTVATPSFLPVAGTYTTAQNITVSSTTNGATIHYTMTEDGTTPADPTESDATYSTGISVTKSGTMIKAKAFKSGMTASSVASAIYTIKPNAPTITGGANVTITGDDGLTFYYTTNGDAPTDASTEYTGAFTPGDCTVKAIAYDTYGNSSAVTTLKYKYLPLAPKNIGSGYYEKVTDVSSLENGDAILIVNEDANVALGPQSGNNCPQKSVTISNNVISNKGDAQKLILVKKTETISEVATDVFYLYTGAAYLYAASGSNNQLKTEATPDDNNNARATISFTSGDARIEFTGTNSRKWLKYNSTSSLFSCYATDDTGQKIVQIYKEVAHSENLAPAKTYTTLTSAYNLDFTSVSSNLKAYIATEVNAGSVQMTQVNKIPANTGLVLKATTPGSAVNVPVFDGTGADDVSENKMAGSATTTTAIAANGGYILSEGAFHPANAGNLPAGKAYLNIAVSAPTLNLDFGGETTGIDEVRGKTEEVRGEFYNLAGQRVAQPTKGLYIVNGKKVIIK